MGPGYLKVPYDKEQLKDARRSAPTASCPRATKGQSSSTTAWRTSARAASGGWPAADRPTERRLAMTALFLLYLLIIGIAVFLGALLPGALRMRRRPGRHPGR